MNILFINPILFTSEKGVIPEVATIKETMCYNMCLGFVAHGHQVTLAAADEYRPCREEDDYAFEVLFFKSALRRLFPPTVLPLSFDLYRYLKANHSKYDLIVSSEVFSFTSLFAARRCPAKTVIWHEMPYHQQKFGKMPSRFWHRVVVPLFMRKVKRVVPRSEKARLFICKYMKNVSTEYVDHGVNVSCFEFSREKKRQFISSSQLIFRKNVERIIEIFGRLVQIKGYGDMQLLIAGRGAYRAYLEALTERLHLQDNVSFLGFLPQKELNDRIKESVAFLIATRRDLNMVSIAEAIVSGTPPVTNLIPASADYVTKEKLGIAKNDWDEHDLIDVIANNRIYVDRCVDYREKLTNSHCAGMIIDIFLET